MKGKHVLMMMFLLQHRRLHRIQQHQQVMRMQLKKDQLRSPRKAKKSSGLLMMQTLLNSISLRWMRMKEVSFFSVDFLVSLSILRPWQSPGVGCCPIQYLLNNSELRLHSFAWEWNTPWAEQQKGCNQITSHRLFMSRSIYCLFWKSEKTACFSLPKGSWVNCLSEVYLGRKKGLV